MKTEIKLRSEIESVISDIEYCRKIDTPENLRKIKKLKERLAYLRMCLMYVESNPSKDFLEKERKRLSNRVALILQDWVDPVNLSKPEANKVKKIFEKEMGIPKIRKQLSAMNFLLS